MFKEELMKKKLAFMIVAMLAVAVCAVSFTACNSSTNPKKLYETLSESRSSMTVEVSSLTYDEYYKNLGQGFVFTERRGNRTSYALVVNGQELYNDEYVIQELTDWAWYVHNTDNEEYEVYFIDGTEDSYDDTDGSPTVLLYDEIELGNGSVYTYDQSTGTVSASGGISDKPTLVQQGKKFTFDDVTLEVFESGAVQVYDKDGEALHLVNLNNLLPGHGSYDIITLTGEGVFLQEKKQVPDSEKDYDLFEDGAKFKLAQYKYEWKNGKISDVDLGYVFKGTTQIEYSDVILRLAVAQITKLQQFNVMQVDDDKLPVDYGVVLFDEELKVAYDIPGIMPGAESVKRFGNYLAISDGALVRYYNSDGDMVAEYAEGSVVEDASGLLKNGYDYFTVEGKHVLTANPEEVILLRSVEGMLYYYQESDDIVRVYDVAKGSSQEICENIDFSVIGGLFYEEDEGATCALYRIDTGELVIDNYSDNRKIHAGNETYDFVIEDDGEFYYIDVETVFS